jgi:hypothetical protein
MKKHLTSNQLTLILRRTLQNQTVGDLVAERVTSKDRNRRSGPPKPMCDASYQSLHGTDVVTAVSNDTIEAQGSTPSYVQYTDQEMIPARNTRNVVTLAVVMFVTIQRENILPSKITDYWLLIN